MSLFLRLFLVLFFQSRGRVSAPLEITRVTTRVMPNDLDLNRHVNNGRVLTLADLGRVDWFYRSGCLKVALREKTMPVVGEVTARFIKQLKLFEKITIESRLLGWSDKWAFLEHRLLRADGQLAAIVVIRGMFWSARAGRVPVSRLLAAVGHPDLASPALPEWVRTWSESLDQLSAAGKTAPASAPAAEALAA